MIDLVLIAVFAVAFWYTIRRLVHHTYRSGYWAGRADSAMLDIYRQHDHHDYADLEGREAEHQQVIAQQLAERDIQIDGLPEWDGIDRIRFVVPEIFHP